MAKDYIDIVGTPQQQGPIQPDYGGRGMGEEKQGNDQEKRLADATERMANASEKQQQINVNVLLDPSKVASQGDVPRLSDAQWSEALGQQVRRGSFSGEGGRFISARKHYWETVGSRKREEFEESVVSSAVRSSEDSRERMLEDQHVLMSSMEEDQRRKEQEVSRKKAIDDSWQLDDSDRRHRRRVAKFEEMFSGLESEAAGPSRDIPGPPRPPLEIRGSGGSGGSEGGSALAGILSGAGLGSLSRFGAAGGLGFGIAKLLAWNMKPEAGGWWQGAITAQREETQKGAEQQAIADRIKDQANFAGLKKLELFERDPAAFIRDRFLTTSVLTGQNRADWSRGLLSEKQSQKAREIDKKISSLSSTVIAEGMGDFPGWIEEDEGKKRANAAEIARLNAEREEIVNNLRQKLDVPQFGRGEERQQESSRRARGLLARPTNRESATQARDEDMFFTPGEVGAFGALSILPGTLRAAGQNPYVPGEMDERYHRYHRQPQLSYSQDHMSRDFRGRSPRAEDFSREELAAPMNYARDTEDDLRAWEKSADNMFEFLKQPEDIRQAFIGNYHYPIQP